METGDLHFGQENEPVTEAVAILTIMETGDLLLAVSDTNSFVLLVAILTIMETGDLQTKKINTTKK